VDDAIAAVRRFSRFYTRRIGVLREGLNGTSLRLPLARIVWELAQEAPLRSRALAARLGIDPGQLSRLLAELQTAGLVARTADPADGRAERVALTQGGRAAYDVLDAHSQAEIGTLLAPLAPPARQDLMAAFDLARAILGDEDRSVVLRQPQAGDMGWVVQRHGALYAAEYGWDARFEALVARIAADFIEQSDDRARGFVGWRDGARAGCAFVTRADDVTAKLRLVLVEPWARGSGLGRALLHAAMGFARDAGYARMTLWTNSPLTAARRLYEREGFALVAAEPVHAFGHAMDSEVWERAL
jgi:DNA-binding MarR family transcriptional regulator/GNAT superfamily N-acetyltransferase